MVIDRPINLLAFQAYVVQVFVPELRSGDVVVMETLATVRETASGSHATLSAPAYYLPPFSPNFNHIGNAFSNIKAFLCKIVEWTVSGLWAAIE